MLPRRLSSWSAAALAFSRTGFLAAKLSPDALTLHSIQARLDPQTALIEFWAGAEGVAAVWVTRESAGISQSHFSAAEMDAFQRFVTGLPDNLGDDWQKDFQKIGSMLLQGHRASHSGPLLACADRS